MGMFSKTQKMTVENVSVINGQAGEDWLYMVDLSPIAEGDLPVSITDWGRDLRVPQAGDQVDVKALKYHWTNVTKAHDDHLQVQLDGLSHIKGPKVETGYVGPLNYHDERSKSA